MLCQWQSFLSLLPVWLREETDRTGREALQELHLRVGDRPELILQGLSKRINRTVQPEDISYCINAATRYSPWAADSLADGYITAAGGHRIGVSGHALWRDGRISGFREIDSLCIRVARDFPGIGKALADRKCATLILGAPGWGKTTLLRDLARAYAASYTVSVIDTRQELFPPGIPRGRKMDVLSGCPKACGIVTALRTMSPEIIAVDEITAQEDCSACLQALGCGVTLLATAHAGSYSDFRRRPSYRPLLEMRVFERIVILRRDKSYYEERGVA